MQDNNPVATLRSLRRGISNMARILCIEDPQIDSWIRALDLKLFPRVDPDFPLIAAICGGGSSGKSTLFNTLIGSRISPTGGRAGMNRRVFMALPENIASRKDFLFSLYEPFGVVPEQLRDPQTLEEPGAPLYMISNAVPKNLILLDTPDFDTGSRGVYANRQEAENALETADVFIYVFTNSNYNNRDNTDFISRMLTGIGMRKAFLVYRAYPGFTDAEVCEHAMTVAKNIYGENAEKYILGIYRADENNAVAAGKAFLSLDPAHTQYLPFHEAIDAIDPLILRKDMLDSVATDAGRKARPLAEGLEQSYEKLLRYTKLLKAIQDTQIRASLRHFPTDRVLKRFTKIWMTLDPPFIRTLRKTGQLMEIPFKLLVKAAKWLGRSSDSESSAKDTGAFEHQVESDLLHAAHELFSAALAEHLSVAVTHGDIPGHDSGTPHETRKTAQPTSPQETFQALDVLAHSVVFPEQNALSAIGWQTTRDAILARKEAIVAFSNQMDMELIRIAGDFRKRMRPIDRIRQSLSAALNILPATLAVTYVLHTGDPVGAVGIKVKLASLLGAKDLYALLAIPATAGLKAADMKQLQEMLEPLARSWFENKYKETAKIFESHITGRIFDRADEALSQSGLLMKKIQEDLEAMESGILENRPGHNDRV